MDIGGDDEEEIRMPISTNFTESSRLKMLATSLPGEDKSPTPKKNVKYRECLKNHAANLGGHITDGCGEFMPSGDEGTLDSLRCAACECHRNFHRREVEGEPPSCDCYRDRILKRPGSSLMPLAFPRPPPQMIMAFNTGPAAGLVPSDADDQEGNFMSPPSALKKRFRTKFSQEQKDRMLAFADKIGWRIQKHDEAAVQQFCQEVGVKRHVLKVWMHNNKHTLGKAHAHADSSNTNTNTATNSSSN